MIGIKESIKPISEIVEKAKTPKISVEIIIESARWKAK